LSGQGICRFGLRFTGVTAASTVDRGFACTMCPPLD